MRGGAIELARTAARVGPANAELVSRQGHLRVLWRGDQQQTIDWTYGLGGAVDPQKARERVADDHALAAGGTLQRFELSVQDGEPVREAGSVGSRQSWVADGATELVEATRKAVVPVVGGAVIGDSVKDQE